MKNAKMVDDMEDVKKAIRSLWKGDLLRRQAEALLADRRASLDDFQPILKAFSKESVLRMRRQKVASWLVQNANWSEEQSTEISLELSGQLSQTLAITGSGMSWYLCFGYSVVLASSAFVFLNGQFDDISGRLLLALLGTAYCAPLICSQFYNRCLTSQSRTVIDMLGFLGNPNSIGRIATAYGHRNLRANAASAMARVTANVQQEHYGTLPANTVPALCDALRRADYDTVLVVLKALRNIGDGRAIKSVERLALKPPNPEIGMAAAELLPILRQRDTDSKAPTQLLRSSQPAQTGGRDLLRGASAATEDDPAQLVRAVAIEQEIL